MADINFEEILKKIADNPDVMSKISNIANGEEKESITDKLPDVIAAISPILNGEDSNASEENAQKTDTPPIKTDESTAPASSQLSLPVAKITEKISKNSKLLLALKPYLSKERADIVDSIIKMAQVADLMKLIK